MKNEYKEHISNTISKLTQSSDKSDKFCFMKHYNSIDIDEGEISDLILSLDIGCELLYHQFDESIIQNAYSPFMPFIKEIYHTYYSDMPIEQFLKESGVYLVILNMFKSYIKNGTFTRDEDIIPREVPYEKEKIIESIIGIIRYISRQHKLVIVLDKLHLAQISTISVLVELIKQEKIDNLVLIAIYNESYHVGSHMKDIWNELSAIIKSHDWTVDCDDDRRILVGNEVFEPKLALIHVYLKDIDDMIMSLALNQAKYYLDIIYRTIDARNSEMNEQIKAKVLYMSALVAIYMQNTKQAYLLTKKMKDSVLLCADNKLYFDYNYILSLVLFYNGQQKEALETIDNGIKIAEIMKDEKKIISAQMTKLIIYLDKFQNVLLWNMELTIPEDILQVAIENNQQMHLVYAYLFGFNMSANMKYNENKGLVGCENVPEFQKGIALAQKLGNTQIQVRAWQTSAVEASNRGEFDEILYYYQRCLEVMKDKGSLYEESQIYNGIGYNCIISERYELAIEYFSRAIDIGIKIDTPRNILDALYNLAINAIDIGDYEATIQYTNVTLKIMHVLQIERLNVCNKTKLYGLIIFSYIKVGQIYNAKLFFDKMETALEHILSSSNPCFTLWEDDIFLYYIGKGMIERYENNINDAFNSFDKAVALWEKLPSKQSYIVPRFIEEVAELYKEFSAEKRRDLLLKGIQFCKERKLAWNQSNLENILNDKPGDYRKTCKQVSEDKIAEIYKMTTRCELKMEVVKKEKMLNFIENCIDLMNEGYPTTDLLIESVMLMIKNTFDIDNMIYINISKGVPKIYYCDNNIKLTRKQVEYICKYFRTNTRKVLISRFQKSYKYHQDLVNALQTDDITSLVAIPFMRNNKLSEVFIATKLKHSFFTENLDMFSEDETEILRTACREMIEAINRDEIKQKLEKSSVTDLLTGLLNRQGMAKIISERLNTLLNPGFEKLTFTILYMDLDNFKYCNDTFGHEVGDTVLVLFSKMLNKIVENTDCVIRYGGDEFLIICCQKDVNYGIQVADKIYKSIKLSKGFKKGIENKIKREINLDERHRVTCSIGIASGDTADIEGISKILKQSDEALYYVKRTTKHRYEIWSPEIANMTE